MVSDRDADAPVAASALQAGVEGVGGWRRLLLAFVMGAVAVAAFPPFHIIPALAPAIAVLIWLSASADRPRDAAVAGLAFGLGHFIAGLYWISGAFMVVGGPASVAAWPAVIGLSFYLALFPAAVCAAYRALCGRNVPFSVTAAITFAALWTLGEWLRGWLLTGFPWNPMGSVWVVSDAMLQVAGLVGVYGLSLITVFTAAAFAGTWWQGKWRGGAWQVGMVPAALIALIWMGGSVRLGQVPAPGTNTVEDVRLRLVQPHIPQRLKWVRELRPRHVQDQIALSLQPGADGEPPPTHVIWAETAIPFYVNGDDVLLRELVAAVPAGGVLLSGGLRRDGDARFNSLFAINGDGRIVASYDKVHLVPFGEYMPLAGLIPFRKLTSGMVDFSAGDGLAATVVAGLPPFQALICYEAIFPGKVTATGTRPAWLLNVTNDAWYGMSSGPHQHFAMVRIRAVEEGVPVVRVANTGISAVVDPYGRVLASLPLGARGIIDAGLPRASAPTVFSTYGNGPVLILAFLAISVIRALGRRPTRLG